MKVLLLGDSHTVGYYGRALEKLFSDDGHDVTRVGVVGAAAYHYNSGAHKNLKGSWVERVGNFDEAIADFYDLAIISLGTNDVTGWTAGEASRQIQQLISRVNAKRKVWVGAPAFSENAAKTYNKVFAQKDLNTRAAELWAAMAPIYGLDAFDPREVTKPYVQQKDIHFKSDGGGAWAVAVYESVMKADVPVEEEQEVADLPPPMKKPIIYAVVGVTALIIAVVAYRKWQKA